MTRLTAGPQNLTSSAYGGEDNVIKFLGAAVRRVCKNFGFKVGPLAPNPMFLEDFGRFWKNLEDFWKILEESWGGVIFPFGIVRCA